MTVIAELKRRNVFKAGAAYVVLAWLVVQGASIAFPAFDAPAWVLRVFILAALLGLPLVLVFAWVFEMTHAGIKAESSGRSDKYVYAAAAALVALALAWYFKGQPSFRLGDAATPASKTTPAVPAAPVAPAKSIAVLAFTDLSPGHDQGYFSDGMAEEILNALAQVKDLKVTGRTSSFFYKGRNEDLRTIGRTLGVANILEGSVRKQGDKVRITAQLIRTNDGFHLWSESYDGDLGDVFKLQERIARAITDKLAVVLDGDPDKPLVPVATNVPEAYALYLRASDIFNRREGGRLPEAIAELDQAIALDPGFARAHARLAAIQALMPIYTTGRTAAALAAVEREAALATRLDPTLAEPYAALAMGYENQGRLVDARVAMDHALALDPNDPTTNLWAAIAYLDTGYTAKGIAQLDHVLVVDPLLPNALQWRGQQYFYAGDSARAEALFRRAAGLGLVHAGIGMHLVEAARGNKAAATRELASGMRVLGAGLSEDIPGIVATGVYGDASARAAALAVVDTAIRSEPHQVSALLPYSLLLLGESRRALVLLQQRQTNNDALFQWWFWTPEARATRALPEFQTFMHKQGRIELWDRYGPPDLCRRIAPGDYACD